VQSLVRLIINLYIAQILFIAITPLALSNPILAAVWPLLFITTQIIIGWHAPVSALRMSPLLALCAGITTQLPSIISALIIISGYSRNINAPDACDFIVQVWYSAFDPLFALLPRIHYHNVPFYFLVNLLLPFIVTPMPMCGIILRNNHTRYDGHLSRN
jgi:hypothetical protein